MPNYIMLNYIVCISSVTSFVIWIENFMCHDNMIPIIHQLRQIVVMSVCPHLEI